MMTWPPISKETRPWAYWWWMGSAVDEENLTRELTRYRDAGMGGVHVIPIYGAKGFEARSVPFLSRRWLDLLRYTLQEAERLGLGIDLTLGTGWCFGGPWVRDEDTNSLVAFHNETITTRPSGQKVKRAAPGGEGWMLNPASERAVRRYLERFTRAFSGWKGPLPRAIYQDSYEYNNDWAPELLAAFEQRQGYRLQDHVSAFSRTDETSRRILADYRATMSDLMVEKAQPLWMAWGRRRGMLSRYEAHGSPGNLLDLYSLADIPETEMFHDDRSLLVSKFASSAAHVTHKRLASSETGTWLKEHFTETLGDLKRLVDDMFLSGINHVFWHGTIYSPDDAAWPGWVFYASTQMNPRNSIWRDAKALHDYITHCQSFLQAGEHDNDVLVYWPYHDYLHDHKGHVQKLTVHQRGWLENQAVGPLAQSLFDRGWQFDFISDKQLRVQNVKGYKAVVVPPVHHMPPETLAALKKLPIPVLFVDQLPSDVTGNARLLERRAMLEKLKQGIKPTARKELEAELAHAACIRESSADQGLRCVRRKRDGMTVWFVVNLSEKRISDISLGQLPQQATVFDPMTQTVGELAVSRRGVSYALEPAGSCILQSSHCPERHVPLRPNGQTVLVRGPWEVAFVSGGPTLPASYSTEKLQSWAEQGGEYEAFAGTARYTTVLDRPSNHGGPWLLHLGAVHESVCIRLNGSLLGTVLLAPYTLTLPVLKPTGNLLELEVTSLAGNRIRDLDRRGVVWRNFYDINFVNIDYKPFDASNWPLQPCGLIGPITLTPLTVLPA